MNAKDQLAVRIADALASTTPKTKERNKALAKVRWTFKVAGISNDLYLSAKVQEEIRPSEFFTDDLSKAAVYDGRDNEVEKQSFFEIFYGERLELVLL